MFENMSSNYEHEKILNADQLVKFLDALHKGQSDMQGALEYLQKKYPEKELFDRKYLVQVQIKEVKK